MLDKKEFRKAYKVILGLIGLGKVRLGFDSRTLCKVMIR
jgi:hypothetical protein